MADEPEVAVAPETGGAAPVVPPPAPEPDYKAQLAELQGKANAEKARLEQQVASYRGIAGQKLDNEAETKRLNRRIERLSQAVDTLLDTQSNGDEVVAQKVATLRQQRAQEEQTDSLTQELHSIWGDVGEEIADAYGLDLETQGQEVARLLQTNPELRNIQTLSQQAWQAQNPVVLRQALKEAKGIRRQVQMATKGREIAEVKAASKKEAEEAAKERLEASGVLTMPAAKPAGVAAKNLEELSNMDTRGLNLKQLREHAAALDAAMGLRSR